MNNSLNVMIDLETLGVGPTAAIVEIGWATFRLDGNGVVRSGAIRVDPASALAAGASLDWSTISWWLTQPDEVRLRLTKEGLYLADALAELYLALQPSGAEVEYAGWWSHGASFDLSILESAIRSVGAKVPWGHRTIRDTRTLFALFEPTWPENALPHSAEADAMAQVGAVQSSFRKYAALRRAADCAGGEDQ